MSNVLDLPAEQLPLRVTDEVKRIDQLLERLHEVAFREPNTRERRKLSDMFIEAQTERDVRLRKITHPKVLLRACAIAHDQPLGEVLSACRSQRLAVVRYHAAWFMRRVAPGIWSFPVIAKAIGRADHSTAFHAVETFDPEKYATAVRVVDEELMTLFRQYQREKEGAILPLQAPKAISIDERNVHAGYLS